MEVSLSQSYEPFLRENWMFFPSNFFQRKVELMPNYCQAVNKFSPVFRSAISVIAIIATLSIQTELVSSAKFE